MKKRFKNCFLKSCENKQPCKSKSSCCNSIGQYSEDGEVDGFVVVSNKDQTKSKVLKSEDAPPKYKVSICLSSGELTF